MAHVVTASSLNLRSAPRVAAATRIATLPQGHRVEKLEDGPAGWCTVRTTLDGAALIGFVASAFLAEEDAVSPPAHAGVTPVHLQENRPTVKRSAGTGRAFPLGEPDRPVRDAVTPHARVAQLHEIVGYLDVERHARYRPERGATYCNIYAYDFCYLARVYLPRVWWTAPALNDLRAGRPVPVRYDDTVRELNANALYDWLRDVGPEFAWRRVVQADELQAAANAGGVGIICAQRRDLNRSGHICVVVPEQPPGRAARRTDGLVHLPLQSQAGRTNACYACGRTRWWADAQFRAFGFWVHE